ncbi:hypothetical protein CBG04_07960 [Limosilactobacillus reuteri]|uniref:DUF3168 domain-containing protein n=1 Tax=Limosilactobacillus reuteri TaxID=1598 RepID=UPI000B999AF2|nr:DUF3168 domain-containing protein [Limosilactobacillus reuteri]OYS79008.1 hypothetical protein CBG11_10620 [Limosilactobacillus reuteri]OYS82714.1 hypothetical protein CBG04_07960 [Limosilactobacillus reuteri]OYS84360.1 hypothetical protein CBG14_05745 [Limosilactobacillus reuteri]
MTPTNELYNYIFDACEKMGYDTYDHLPLESENAKYPFVVCGEQQQTNTVTTTSINSTIYMTVHVWGSRRQRDNVAKMMANVATLSYDPALRTEHHFFTGKPNLIDNQIMIDDTIANTLLWHGVITMAFYLR